MSGLPCIELSDPICDMVAVCETTTTLASNVYTNEDGITSDVVTSNTLSLTAGNLTSSVNGVVSNTIPLTTSTTNLLTYDEVTNTLTSDVNSVISAINLDCLKSNSEAVWVTSNPVPGFLLVGGTTSGTMNGLPANLAKVGSGEFRNIIASELHGSNSYSHFWRVDEQIDYQVLSADLTLTNDSPGVLHVNGGLGTRVVVLPTPTLVAPNLHGMTFSIKNIGTTNNIEVREGTPTGTLRGTLLPGEWATYRWDTNFPRYFEWK